MPVNFTHQGADPLGALTTHRGLLEDCPAPECQDRVIQQREGWGIYCPHGTRIVERDPDLTDPDSYPVGRLVTPWPCHAEGCTPEAFERAQQDDEIEYWNGLMSEVYQ